MNRWKEILAAFLEIVGPIVAVAGAAILLVQFVILLRIGEWPALVLADAWEYFGLSRPGFFGWKGVQIAFEWLLQLPLGAGLVLAGLVLTLFSQEIAKLTRPPNGGHAT